MTRLRGSTAERPIDARAFDLLSMTLAMVLGLHAAHLPWWLVAALGVILGWRWWQRQRRIGRVPRWLKLPLLALLTLAVVLQYGNIFGREPGTALAVGLLILKLLETETTRDARVGISFACFALMTALLFDQGMLVTFIVALGLLPVLATLRALEPAQEGADSLPRSLLPGLVLTAAALPLALLAFLLVPRLDSPLWGAPTQNEASTGLADSMSPGKFAELLLDESPAMRVSFDGAPPPRGQRYFRAYVMAGYDGFTWKFRDLATLAPSTLEVAGSTRYQISLVATHQNVLPTLDVPVDAPKGARMRSDRVVIADKPVNDALTYRLSSATRYRLEPEPLEHRRRWLQLPSGFNPRALALGKQWRQRHGSDDGAIVREALALFHDGGFSYTLAPAPLGRDAMDDFLFDTHQGSCEHYASAFTVLMRAAGIPARVVTGYQGGYWNKLGNYLLVRNSDAHAWSEAWLAGRGWVRVDPTAAVRPERVSQGAAAAAGEQLGWYQSDWLQGLRNHWDIVNRWWDQGVTGFDALRQRGLLKPFGIRDTDTTTLGWLLAISSMLFIGIGLGWALLRRQTRDPLREALRELERKLARKGIARRPGEGPKHYLGRAARALPDQREAIAGLMRSYLELRYAHVEPPTEPLRSFIRSVRDFRIARVVK
ncbi:transglutaminase TgpA family protein [Rhodanobacter ginsengiterrae]|uniref:transglutaminase TgpA family protein n=1 Tax=Rhodanobacter ginsengiterrae TaxID=2008451 RepID=UPI003CF7004E